MVEQLSEFNAGFRAECDEQDATSGVDSMIDHIGRSSMNSMCLCEGSVTDPEVLVGKSKWVDIEFEVAIDSSATDHVCHSGDVPGYVIEASPGSRAGQGLIAGNGARVPNNGQSLLSLQASGKNRNSVSSMFQFAAVSRPLMGVGRLCDNCVDIFFKKD